MNRDDRLLLVTGSLAASFGVGSGAVEVLAGTASWVGNMNDPTTLEAWIPAAIASLAAGVVICWRPRQAAAWRSVVRTQWAAALVVVLSAIYLAFGIVSRESFGMLGVVGAGLAWAALGLRRRARLLAAAALSLAALPFAAATVWTVVTPLTAALMLAIGLPHLLGHRNTTPSGGTS
jgi:hypothetical protein